MSVVAAVDCGTNSIRLLISEQTPTGLREITRQMTIIRLGEGVDATGKIDPAAIERARVALSGYVDTMVKHKVTAVRMVATSATRDASNKDDFFAMTADLLGTVVPGACAEVISGAEEAELSFIGAVADIPDTDRPVCVIDLGGGSTEFVVGKKTGEILGAYSTQMGCVRLTERLMVSDPPTAEELAQAREYVDTQLTVALDNVPIAQASMVIGCAGTFTTVAALTLGLDSYDPQRIHGSVHKADTLRGETQRLIGETSQQRAAHSVMHPGRADVIAGGSVVIEQILAMIQRLGVSDSVTISEKDILDGIVSRLFGA
ncbi:Ppx/GppA phosphatase family protein [Corynebacterium belfantii]|uniref:Ppx/GppA phosphatase family protein n=1 Tax=Corynebacterium belfantii TaxID=2014537 RepID=UPI0018C93B75|nr:Ppx/GppA phosphatase family protein [Corynebacterium belfantii]QVI97905.1 Ppx/GppA family phosphatase [Corynebacterium diphtheriae]MBG9242776.1 Ppx/GppA family phosphatase [Corynebacterium belfantii]MBG9260158.1 Ppx/GppA family phosphatase [Corynebacterium belfantii]MBG9266903.1 Ppx/GppA family phosphatase [Corynebacterium belfantii]MBG9298191.1 Ppx/GppA family phosphatase [Corynebacterium belfantii]